jgi:hypothetical protein
MFNQCLRATDETLYECGLPLLYFHFLYLVRVIEIKNLRALLNLGNHGLYHIEELLHLLELLNKGLLLFLVVVFYLELARHFLSVIFLEFLGACLNLIYP